MRLRVAPDVWNRSPDAATLLKERNHNQVYMCEKQERINELERELQESHQREADLFKTLAEAKNHESQTIWRPVQVMAVGIMIPTFVAMLALIAALTK